MTQTRVRVTVQRVPSTAKFPNDLASQKGNLAEHSNECVPSWQTLVFAIGTYIARPVTVFLPSVALEHIGPQVSHPGGLNRTPTTLIITGTIPSRCAYVYILSRPLKFKIKHRLSKIPSLC